MHFAPGMGWPELTVVPLDMAMAPRRPKPSARHHRSALALTVASPLPDALRLLPARCPYPAETHGAAILVHGELFSLDWFEVPACAQVYWYPMILAGMEQALRDASKSEDDAKAPAEPPLRQRILDLLAHADCFPAEGRKHDGTQRAEITTGSLAGHAICRDQTLVRLQLQPCPADVIYQPHVEKTVDSIQKPSIMTLTRRQ
jgi:hypothetical protein